MFVQLIGVDTPTLARLMSGKRIRGTLGLAADGTLNFHAWNEPSREPCEYIRLRHGRASVSPHRIRLRLDMERAEKIDPVNAIYSDLYDAVSFIREEVKPTTETEEDGEKRPA